MPEVTPIRKLLIANRGEIAVRIARTAHRMGIATVGVYSEPDAGAVHADAVDVAVALGGATPAESYLDAAALVAAAQRTGCDTVHPGYGFLAESPDFARAVLDAGLVWVGPPPEQIELLGDKIAAKATAVAARVPVAAVWEVEEGTVPDGVTLPAVVKAAAGGGGRGMRIVHVAGDLEAAVIAAAREAASAFGDGRVFIEPYVAGGRHVEVQILGDTHGNLVHLGERECSIQRRHQKLIEEAPSPGIGAATRQAVWDGALALAEHVGYRNAGTVEFLVGADGAIDFLEVNTRLQVEHPVTEAITGLDLVELQLRIAAGEALPFGQEDVTFTGHAIEARIVAEDPAAGWLPAAGRLRTFSIGEGVRIDSGVAPGTEISSDYDSLLAKAIAHGATRGEAVATLARTLRGARVSGVPTNLDAVVAILGEDDFVAGVTPTSYLEDHPDVLQARGPRGDDLSALLVGAVFAAEQADRQANRVTGFAPSGWRNLRTMGQRQVWERNGEEVAVEFELFGSAASVLVGPWPRPRDDGTLPEDPRAHLRVRLLDRSRTRQVVEIDGIRHVVDFEIDGEAVVTSSRNGSATWRRVPRFVVHDAEEAGSGPVCPLPGTVIAVPVVPGDHVDDGAVLMVIEAMKMEHAIRAAAPGTVAEVRFEVGDRVDAGVLLVRLEGESGAAPPPV